MKKSKKIIILISLIIVISIALLVVYMVNFKDENALTLEENKWIEENKFDVLDIALINDIPMLSYDGEGFVYDYLDFVTKNTSLNFNVIAFKLDNSTQYDYKMNIVDELSKNDIELFKDNLSLVTYSKESYLNVDEINNMKLGVLVSDKEKISSYLKNNSITYVEYNTYAELKNSIIVSKNQEIKDETTLDGIIILKNFALKEVIENDLNISYNFDDLSKSIVLTINNNENLNTILSKKFKEWKNNEFDNSYNEYLLESYFKFKNISDAEQKKLKSKNYTFGFIDYGIYNNLKGNKLSGLNNIILKNFNKFSNLSITYTQYNSIGSMLKEFNAGKIDFVFNLVEEHKYKNKVYKTKDVYNSNLVVVSHNNSNISISSIDSLKNTKVLTIKDSYVEKILNNNNIKYKSYKNMEDLTKEFDFKDIVIIDIENYNFYKTTAFKNSRISYMLDYSNKYNFIINDKEENKLFQQLFDFYLSYNSINKLVSNEYVSVVNNRINYEYLFLCIIIIFGIYIILDFYNHLKQMVKTLKNNTKEKLTKNEKIKYIDQLTSLKNRTYLNSKIEIWDESEVYPQSIIIFDLNNVSYINDNYGREEGDKVIKEAANILIQNQMQNSEIIRTDGNEFLIYLVGYSEKQIISYIRKLNKEFKNLSHGFGIASGYSIINDAIKTIDDAVNEATLAMKENKEDIDY